MASNLVTYQNAIVSSIQGLSLTGLQSTSVVARRRPWDENGPIRGLVVHPLEPGEANGTEAREDIGYKFGITVHIGNDHTTIEGQDRVASWFEAIRKKIINRRLSVTLASGDTNLITQMTNGQLHIPKELMHYEFSSLFVICFARESRT